MTAQDRTEHVAELLGVELDALVDAVMAVTGGTLNVQIHVHGTSARYKSGCRCEVCVDQARSVRRRQRQQAASEDPDARGIPHGKNRYDAHGCRCDICKKAKNASTRASRKRLQEASQQAASRHGYHWTGPELELAARRDLTAPQVAKMIGRTVVAVENMREKLHTDPKTITRAGISRLIQEGEE